MQAIDLTFKRPAINNRRLFDPKNPARMLVDITLNAHLSGSFVEFANGDILPGRIVPGAESESVNGRAISVSVLVSSPLSAKDRRRNTILVLVRPEWIVRIFRAGEKRKPLTLSPGLVVLRRGRRLTAKAVMWTTGGLRLLLASSVETVAWDKIAEFHCLEIDRAATGVGNMLAAEPGKPDFICRMVTTNGAAISHHFLRTQSLRSNNKCLKIVQPAWSLNAIYVPLDSIVSESYRRPDEIPLSSLPTTVLSQKNMTGFTWAWRRNRNIRGGQLASGRLRSDLGVGMHSHSEIAFELPPGAKTFSAWVGLDRAVKKGGCVRCKIYLNDVSGAAVWDSGILLGGNEPVRVELSDLKGAKRLVLVAEFAHSDRPAGADPLDIRDEVSWLWPTVKVDLSKRREAPDKLMENFPQLAGWSVSDEMRKRISARPRPFFDARGGRWVNAMVLDAGRNPGEKVAPLIVTKDVSVNFANAWLLTASGRDASGSLGFRITVRVDGKQINGTEGYNSNTTGYPPGDMDTVAYGLGQYIGKKVRIRLAVAPGPNDIDHKHLCGMIWERLSFTPAITDLPSSAKPIAPDVLLSELKPLKVDADDGKTPGHSNVVLRFCRMDNGLVMPPGVRSVTYQLDKRWQRFVACVGPQRFSHGNIDSFQILIDGNLVCSRNRFTRLSPAVQIDIPLLPGGGKRITLQVVNESKNTAVWANAGFKLK